MLCIWNILLLQEWLNFLDESSFSTLWLDILHQSCMNTAVNMWFPVFANHLFIHQYMHFPFTTCNIMSFFPFYEKLMMKGCIIQTMAHCLWELKGYLFICTLLLSCFLLELWNIIMNKSRQVFLYILEYQNVLS